MVADDPIAIRSERDALLAERQALAAERDALRAQLDAVIDERDALRARLATAPEIRIAGSGDIVRELGRLELVRYQEEVGHHG